MNFRRLLATSLVAMLILSLCDIGMAADITATVSEIETAENAADGVGEIRASAGFVDEISADVPQTSEYTLSFEYRSVSENSNDGDISVTIDDLTQYDGMGNQKLPRLWKIKETKKDSDGNDLRGEYTLSDEWTEYTVHNSNSSFSEAYRFQLTAGKHKVKLTVNDGDFIIRNLHFEKYVPLISYEDYLKENGDYPVYSGENLKFEAEKPLFVNSRNIITDNNINSPQTTPQNPGKTLLNVIGGNNWNTNGQRIDWVVNVPETAYYRVNFRYLQNLYSGFNAFRTLYVNGKIPFDEAKALTFSYSDKWQTFNAKQYVFLQKGKNTLSLECAFGDYADIYSEINNVISDLNAIYRNILMVVGSNPDAYRDYHLETEIPDISESMKKCAESLQSIDDKMLSASVGNSGQTVAVKDTVRQLNDMSENLRSVTKGGRISSFKSNISSIAAFSKKLCGTPLILDSIVLSGEEKVSLHNESLGARLKYSFKRFFASFVNDYNGSETEAGRKQIKVWINTGRDQLQIMKTLVENGFIYEYGVGVNMQLVTGSVIQAFLAGTGPDVCIGRTETDVVNFAMRGALVDLRQFDGFESVISNYSKDAFVPFTYRDGIYAIPDKQEMDMMFVRTDVLSELELKIPQTWTELKTEVIPVLLRNYFTVGLGLLNKSASVNSSNLFYTLLYQNGGSLYNSDKTKTDMDNNTALQAFEDAVMFYREYGIEREYDFLNRFRTGESPIMIASYINYNNIKAGAPEIDGLWEMYPIPGTEDENGNINRTQLMTSTGCVIFSNTKNKNECWNFINWFNSAEVQRLFGIDQEAVLGASGRYPTANINAINGLGWTKSQLEMLDTQRRASTSFVQIPGSYYTAKEINNAIVMSVTDTSVMPREKLLESVELIDIELERKRKEFS